MTLYHFYRLINNTDTMCYIGHTRRELRKRLYDHRHGRKDTSAQSMFIKYGKENVSIVLIHSMEFENIREAHQEERRLIEEYKDTCVNIQIPFREENERKALAHSYYLKNQDKRKTQRKEYYEKNKNRLKLSKEVAYLRYKAYREANQEKENARKRAWYYKNKAKLIAVSVAESSPSELVPPSCK